MSAPRRTTKLALVVALALAGCRDDADDRIRRPMERGLIILGVDGMDPEILRRVMREGRAPNLKRMAEQGGFIELATSNPPQSPVAWSHFITGHDSSHHGIYDFVHRDPVDLAPYLSTSRAEGPEDAIELGSLQIPLGAGEVVLLRDGLAFWELLEKANVPATIFKVPANFPPHEDWRSETLSGMGTPDLMGTYGTFQLFTDDPERAGRPASGGVVHRLDFGGGQKAVAHLAGPPDPFSAAGDDLELPLEVVVDRERDVALVRLDDESVILRPGEWSGWYPVRFPMVPLAGDAPGMVRLYLDSVRPFVRLYVSPINLDPLEPAMPISSPRSYAAEVARDAGRYYTQGMPEDTKALAADVLDDDAFLAQARSIFEERKRLLKRELDRFQGGLLFFYFSSIDQVSHVFYRAIKPGAPPEVAKYAHVIPDLYAEIDRVVGEVLERAGPNTTVLVMSDHGFAPYDRKVNLNSWLESRGYLALAEERGDGPLGHIDWSRTQAYALGINQLFVNLKGREAHGIVPPEEKDLLLRRLARELESFRDPDTGARVVSRAFVVEPGRHPDRAPDLIVGFARGYRSSDESATGMLSDAIVEDNTSKWSGDHCMDPALVPGVLLSSRPLAVREAALTDLAPTILTYFGADVPADMPGKSVLPAP